MRARRPRSRGRPHRSAASERVRRLHPRPLFEQREATMRALTVAPGRADSARVEDVPEPPADDGPVLVQTLAVGVCGTDLEIVSGNYGWSPPGKDRLVLGHESLGRVLEAPAESGLKP